MKIERSSPKVEALLSWRQVRAATEATGSINDVSMVYGLSKNISMKPLSMPLPPTHVLLFHFSYASWNGEGWFKRFATSLNSAIKNNAPDIFAAAFFCPQNSDQPCHPATSG